jgi:beta-galactosidase
MLEHARAIAYYDHPFFGRWPAITENQFGSGTLLYEGAYLSDELQTAVLRSALKQIGLIGPDQELPATVHAQTGVNRFGKRVHYYFNYSGAKVSVTYTHADGVNLLDGNSIARGSDLNLDPWDLAIVEEDTPSASVRR